MAEIQLAVTTREILGKKVRFLRRQGITPVHLFGHNVESVALQCDTAQLERVLAQAGRTRLVGLRLDKATKLRNVLVREVQRNPPTGELLHVDFYQVRRAEKVSVEIPIALVGEAPALRFKENLLTRELNSLTIECLPDKIPASVELDISSLSEAAQAIRVKDIRLDKGLTVLNDPEQIVVKISALAVERAEEAVAEEEAATPSPEEESKEE